MADQVPLALPLYAPGLLIEELRGPLSPNIWNIARRNAKARRDIPGAITNEQLLYCWGMGAFSLPERCAVEPGDMVLDARWGAVDTTLYFSRLCRPTGHVHAFEPMPANYATLNVSLTTNNVTNVTTVCRVLSDRVGSMMTAILPKPSDGDPQKPSCRLTLSTTIAKHNASNTSIS